MTHRPDCYCTVCGLKGGSLVTVYPDGTADVSGLGTGLTPKEHRVMRRIASGLPIDTTCKLERITRHTYYQHRSAAYRKLGVDGLMDALRALGWLQVPGE